MRCALVLISVSMDSDRIEIASILVHLVSFIFMQSIRTEQPNIQASTFGCITNSVAVATIKKCVNLHTSLVC